MALLISLHRCHLCQVVGRHVASDRMVSGAYKSEFGESDEISQCMQKVEVSLLAFFAMLQYHKCGNLIGYATCYLFCDR